LEIRSSGRILEIFDYVELDAAALEQLKRAARVSSAGVMIKFYFRHDVDQFKGEIRGHQTGEIRAGAVLTRREPDSGGRETMNTKRKARESREIQNDLLFAVIGVAVLALVIAIRAARESHHAKLGPPHVVLLASANLR